MRIDNARVRAGILVALLLLVAVFVANRIRSGAGGVDRADIAAHAPLLLVAVALLVLAIFCLAFGWTSLVAADLPRRTGARRAELVTAFLFAWPGRYVPGTVPFFAGKIYLGRRLGYQTRRLVVATAIENVIEVLVAAVVGCAMLSFAGGASGHLTLSLVGLAIAAGGLCALHPALFRRLTGTAMAITRREPIAASDYPSSRALVTCAACITVGHTLSGLAMLAVLHALAGSGWAYAALAIGAVSLSGVAGLLVVFAPAGLGVRDGALAALLAARVGIEVAATAAILQRLLSVAADIVIVAAALIFDVASGQHLGLQSVRAALRQEGDEPRATAPATERAA